MLLNLIGKDFKRALRDKKALIILLLMPAVLITILGFSVGKFLDSEDGWIEQSTIGIVNLDNGEEAVEKIIDTIRQVSIEEEGFDIGKIREGMESLNFEKILLEDILGSDEINKFLSYKVLDEAEALELLKEKQLSAIVTIPKDFTYKTMMTLVTPFTYKQEIQVLKHKENVFAGRIVEEVMKGFTEVLSSGIIAKTSLLEIGAELGIGDKLQLEIEGLLEGVLTQSSQIRIETKNINSVDTVSGMQYYSIGLTMMFVLYVAGYGAKYAFDEKNYHTYERLILSNVSNAEILISRGITTFLIALMQIIILIIYSIFIFKISWGEPFSVLVLSICMALSVGGMGAFLTAVNYKLGNAKVSNMFENIVIMIFASLGGSFIPVSGIPIINKIGAFTPNGAAINGYMKLMQGYGISSIMGTITLLISLFIGLWLLAIIILKQGEVV